MEYNVQGYYAQGWEDVFTAETREEANRVIEEYRRGEPGIAFRVKGKRG